MYWSWITQRCQGVYPFGFKRVLRWRIKTLWVLAALLGMVGSAGAGSQITFNLKDADIQTVIATVSEFTGRNFIVDPRVKGKVTVISARPMGREEVYQTFLSLLEVHNFAAVPSGSLIKIIPDVSAKQSSTPVVNASSPGRGDEMVTRVIQIQHVTAAQLVPILRPLVPQQGHLAAYTASNMLILSDRASNVARLLQIIHRIDVAMAHDIEVIALKHASAAEVVRILETLKRQGGKRDANASGPVLVADERTNSILISGDKSNRLNTRALITHLDTPLETTGNTKVIYLRYAKAKDLVPVLTGLGESVQQEKKGGVKGTVNVGTSLNIQAHESTNALVITAPPDILRSLEGVIRKLDIRRAQVLVEAVIADISQRRLAELGVQWLFDGSPSDGPVGGVAFGGSTNIVGLAAGISAGATTAPSITGALMGLGRFNSDTFNFGMLINALEGDGDTNILSKPTIVTLDNEEAEIVVGQNVPFVTGSFSSTGSGSTPTNPFQTIKRENVGITLKVKPQINEGDAVKLDIEQKVDDVAANSGGAADLVTNTRSIRTSVLVDDGGVIALGGLIKDDLRETEQRVPGLGSIPVLGALFRNKSTTKDKTSLMVFIRPVILRDAATTTRVSGSKYNFMRSQQLAARENGVAMMNDNVSPLLPEFEEFMKLPSLYDDIQQQESLEVIGQPVPGAH